MNLFFQRENIKAWMLHRELPCKSFAELNAILSDDELKRAARYTLDEPRQQFIHIRGSLRFLLGLTRDVSFELTDQGKPYLKQGPEFNIAHSGAYGVIAVSDRRIGVDVEVLRPMDNAAGLVRRFFSSEEQQQFAALPEVWKLAGFFRGWTAKEALLKAVGVGLIDLESCSVDLDPRQPPRVIRFSHLAEKGLAWTLEAASFHDAVAMIAYETSLGDGVV